jgi:hypothetical protein
MSVRADVIKQVLDYGGLDYWWLFADLRRVAVVKSLTAAGVIDRNPATDAGWTWIGYDFGPAGPPPGIGP